MADVNGYRYKGSNCHNLNNNKNNHNPCRRVILIVIFIYGIQEANYGALRWKEWDDVINSRSITCAFSVKQGQWRSLLVKPLEWQKVWNISKFGLAMGGDPITTEPAVLVVDEEVRHILEEAGFLAFFNKFKGHSEGITK